MCNWCQGFLGHTGAKGCRFTSSQQDKTGQFDRVLPLPTSGWSEVEHVLTCHGDMEILSHQSLMPKANMCLVSDTHYAVHETNLCERAVVFTADSQADGSEARGSKVRGSW